ncbi:MAG TPA: hypothetical protein VFG68_13105 [Fimbriiglobus sp.]|nr:hypothetical protein [Fimbriiglobus sp.]
MGPETCGWHSVEGLRATDERRLALCWDMAGLGPGQVVVEPEGK